MTASEFSVQCPPGYEHEVALKIFSPCPPWNGKTGRYLRGDNVFVTLEVFSEDERFEVNMPWSQVGWNVVKTST